MHKNLEKSQKIKTSSLNSVYDCQSSKIGKIHLLLKNTYEHAYHVWNPSKDTSALGNLSLYNFVSRFDFDRVWLHPKKEWINIRSICWKRPTSIKGATLCTRPIQSPPRIHHNFNLLSANVNWSTPRKNDESKRKLINAVQTRVSWSRFVCVCDWYSFQCNV